MRRFRPGLVILALILTLFPALCRAEGESILSLQEKEWTWEKNNIASFEGSASLASMPQGKLLLTLEIETEPKATDPGQVVFQTVNGKKLTIKKQKPEYTITHEDSDELTFIGSWKTPDDVFFTKVEITFRICTEDGKTVLAEKKMTAGRTKAEMAEADDGKIKLKADFAAWTLWVGISAGVIWLLAVIRIVMNRIARKKG